MIERGGRRPEGIGGWSWRRKGGLETPLTGRFVGESKRLIFAPPLWYDGLVLSCILGGPAMALVGPGLGLPVISHAPIALYSGAAVCIAGLWGAMSNERMSCDLRQRTYARLEGQGLWKRLTRGSLAELDALVLVAEEYPMGVVGRTVIYRLVLYWKGQKEPLLVVGRESRQLPGSGPPNVGAGPMLHKGARYAQALGIPFHDNSYFSSPAPVPVL